MMKSFGSAGDAVKSAATDAAGDAAAEEIKGQMGDLMGE